MQTGILCTDFVCGKADFDVNEFVVASQTSPQSVRKHVQAFLRDLYHHSTHSVLWPVVTLWPSLA